MSIVHSLAQVGCTVRMCRTLHGDDDDSYAPGCKRVSVQPELHGDTSSSPGRICTVAMYAKFEKGLVLCKET